MNNVKQANTNYPIHELLAKRFSPYLFDPRPVEPSKLATCFEAARWAASSYNEQPWSFIVAERDESEQFARMLSCLVEANRNWAENAGTIILTVI